MNREWFYKITPEGLESTDSVEASVLGSDWYKDTLEQCTPVRVKMRSIGGQNLVFMEKCAQIKVKVRSIGGGNVVLELGHDETEEAAHLLRDFLDGKLR